MTSWNSIACVAACLAWTLTAAPLAAGGLEGQYVEARTCQVYTGPCFANSEINLAGKDAVMAWRIESGDHQGIDLEGLGVAVVVRASDTLGFAGLDDAESLKSMIIVDRRADSRQRAALLDFVRSQASEVAEMAKTVTADSFDFELDPIELVAKVKIGRQIQLETRKARPTDCICSNEIAYYPPLVPLVASAPGVTVVGEVSARTLGTRWSIPETRSAYVGRFAVE